MESSCKPRVTCLSFLLSASSQVWIDHNVKDPPGRRQQQYNDDDASNYREIASRVSLAWPNLAPLLGQLRLAQTFDDVPLVENLGFATR